MKKLQDLTDEEVDNMSDDVQLRGFLAVCQTGGKYRYITIAEYVGEYEEEYDGGDDGFGVYCEDTDEYYIPEGYYHSVNDEEKQMITDEITHYMKLPDLPER